MNPADNTAMDFITAEFHCHSYSSKDSLSSPKDLLAVMADRGLARLAITDHNVIGGALEAQALEPEKIIVGEEIMTTRGELLTFFMKEEIRAGLTPEETIHLLRNQNAFISASHPFDSVRSGSWEEADLQAIVPYLDAIEVFNARTMSNEPNKRATAFAEKNNLLGTAGSDAHSLMEVGRAQMKLEPFYDAASLRRSLQTATYTNKRSSPLIHFTSRYAVWRKKLGWEPE